jgi:hypothetical protein
LKPYCITDLIRFPVPGIAAIAQTADSPDRIDWRVPVFLVKNSCKPDHRTPCDRPQRNHLPAVDNGKGLDQGHLTG